MTFSTKSPEANWPNASNQLEHNKRLREENAGLLAEVERLRNVLQDAMARPDEISSDLMDVFAAGIETGRLMLENANLRRDKENG